MKKLLLIIALTVSSFAGELVIDKLFAKNSPNIKNGAVFMHIKNDLEADVKLIGGSSSVCETVELHTHKMVDGMKMMVQVDAIDVPKGGTAQLVPGGLHVMLMGLKQPLVAGEMIDLTLKFDTGKSVVLKDVLVTDGKKRLFLEK